MKTLNLREAIALLNTGEWLTVRFITADLTKGTGGTVMQLNKCRVVFKQKKAKSSTLPSTLATTKRQNHFENFTINVELPNRHVRKIHIPLITHLNQIPVV